MIWYFIDVSLHGRLEIRNFASNVEKHFIRSLRSLVHCSSTLEKKSRNYVMATWNDVTYILLDVLLCSIAEYFYELCRILTSP